MEAGFLSCLPWGGTGFLAAQGLAKCNENSILLPANKWSFLFYRLFVLSLPTLPTSVLGSEMKQDGSRGKETSVPQSQRTK